MPMELGAISVQRCKPIQLPVEWVEEYRPGGLHPVDLGDVLAERYLIVNKLGYGAYSTVWLATDRLNNDAFIALKVHRADSKVLSFESSIQAHLNTNLTGQHCTNIVKQINYCTISGPNGRHYAEVFELMGPNASSAQEHFSTDGHYLGRFPFAVAKSILKQILLALCDLHLSRVCHGDLQPGNMLFCLRELSVEDKAYLANPPDRKAPVERLDGTSDSSAPKHIYDAISLVSLVDFETNIRIKLSDLESALTFDEIPEKHTVPVALRAPELIFSLPYDHRIDVGSFGCLIFELITGNKLFQVSEYLWTGKTAADDAHLIRLTDILGPLPISLQKSWSRSSRYYNADGEHIRTNVGERDVPADVRFWRSHLTKAGRLNVTKTKHDKSLLSSENCSRTILMRDPMSLKYWKTHGSKLSRCNADVTEQFTNP